MRAKTIFARTLSKGVIKRNGMSVLICTITLTALLASTGLGSFASYAQDSEPKKSEIYSDDFWIKKLEKPDQEILTPQQIKNANQESLSLLKGVLYDLTAYPSSLSKDELTELLNKYSFSKNDRYVNNQKVTPEYYDALKALMNLDGVKDTNEVRYGITVNRTNVRTFPTSDGIYTTAGAIQSDMFQETEVRPAEPVLILHRSTDGKWGYVQTFNYSGWMLIKDVAIARDKAEWKSYISASKFLVVTANKLTLGYNPYSPELSQLKLYMGNKLPLASDEEIPAFVDKQSTKANYVVKLPVRGQDGSLAFKLALIPVNSDVSIGYMTYTRANIIRQAFKSLGERYGWGGEFDSKDCSSFVESIFSSFGFVFARNTGEQINTFGKNFDFEALNSADRMKILDGLLPGATLHFSGHTMLYLGKDENKYYIIHDVDVYGNVNNKLPDGTYERINVNQVAVTDLSMIRPSGAVYLDVLTRAKLIE